MSYANQLIALVPRAREVVAGLSVSQINWHPLSGSWSIAECLAHLNTTNEHYISALEKTFSEGRERAWLTGQAEPKIGFFERWFANSLEPPYKFRFKAPQKFAPPSHRYEQDELLARWVSIHQRLAGLATENSDLDWKKIRVPSPASQRIRLSPMGVFAVILAHDRRHLWQAGQIRIKLPPAN